MTFVSKNLSIFNHPVRFVDVHCHLTDEKWETGSTGLSSYLKSAQDLGIGLFVQGGIGPEEWDKQIQLMNLYPKQIALCFGLHPYWITSHSREECELAMDQLARKISQASLLGEMGLDFRSRLNNVEMTPAIQELQMELLEQQLELAHVCSKPIVLHIVRAHSEVLKILEHFKDQTVKGFVHSFNSSWQVAQKYLDLDLMISVGGPLLRKNKEALEEVIAKIPLERLLIETDAPDQPPQQYEGQLNPLSSLWDVAAKVAEIKQKSPEDILTQSAINFKNLFV